ncbi:MAG: four helix bundle protein [Cyanobacteriota bacterium]|nr:four helix bundle protein [Cyanobacteriota bacterium]
MNDGWEKLMEIGERTFQFAVRIVKLGQFIEKNGGVTKILSGQVLRSGTSIGANVAEAQSAQSRKDFISKLEIALKEARETQY